jgi:hypothetical protein
MTRVATLQNILDVAVQEYGSIEGLFKVIDQNPDLDLSIDAALLGGPYIGDLINADNRTEQEIELVTKFFLDDQIVVNEDMNVFFGGAYSDGYSEGYVID